VPPPTGRIASPTSVSYVAEPALEDESSAPGAFERDTAVRALGPISRESEFAANVGVEWRAGRGPHGGYLAATILRAMTQSVDEPQRSPRSLTVHYARAPKPGPVAVKTVMEREGRSLSTVSARMEQDGTLVALALAAFSVPWPGPELADIEMPEVAPPDPERRAGLAQAFGLPPFHAHMVMQPRLNEQRRGDGRRPMEFAAWLGLAEARPVDALSLAFFSDALIPAPFMATEEPAPAPTIDLTIHFRVALPRVSDPDPYELCFARVRAGVVHEGFFEEDETIWSADGTLLAQSRQLAILMGGSPISG
jgi:acyl-CoA thioesterase